MVHATEFLQETAVAMVDAPVYRPCTLDDAVKSFALPSIDDLTTAHMTPEQKARFDQLLTRVREWREGTRFAPGLSMMLMSRQVGIGKTHIARSVVSSFSAIIGELYYLGDEPQFALETRARLYTARELISYLGGDEARDVWTIVPHTVQCLVIDDLGREGYLDFVKADQQQAEKQARYFHLINHLYQRWQNGRYPVSLFITTNLNSAECQELLGEAVWSRLLEMCPRGYIVEVSGLEDYRRVKSGRK
jgi:DNA replication protein DnaC